jgi:hypothetical protein
LTKLQTPSKFELGVSNTFHKCLNQRPIKDGQAPPRTGRTAGNPSRLGTSWRADRAYRQDRNSFTSSYCGLG